MMFIHSMVMVSSIFLILSMVTPTYQQLPQQLQGYRMEQAMQVQSSDITSNMLAITSQVSDL